MQWTLLAILAEGPKFGLEVKHVFDNRTGDMWPLNAGQVYSTLARLDDQGYVDLIDPDGPDGQKTYAITDAGRARLDEWFSEPVVRRAPMRDETVLKILMASADPQRDLTAVFTVERMAALKRLQDLTRLKQQDPSAADLGWQCLLDSLIYQAEARIRWLDACETRLTAKATRRHPDEASAPLHTQAASELTFTERQESR